MALYRFEAKVISRSGGRSTVHAAAYRTGKTATSAAAYRHGDVLKDERTGETYDYTRKRGIAGSEILAPENAPAWALDRQQLWNQVERVEKRKDAQLARDFIVSLPHELDREQRRALLTEFLERNFVEKGYLCDVAYHDPHGKGDDRNHHAHVMVPMRRLDAEGFAAKKDRPQGNPIDAWQTELARWRKDWADTTNRHLEAAGSAERVSHLSLAEQGIDRAPEPKQGAIATKMEQEGRESHAGNDRRQVKAENAERQALAAEMENLVNLSIEIMRRRNMDEPNERQIDEQHRIEAAKLKDAKEVEEAITAWRKKQEAEAEEAKQKGLEHLKERTQGREQGEIADASTRYSVAVADTYSARDPYASLAGAAVKELALFKKDQDDLKRQIARETDEKARGLLELRRQIEAHEYMAITSQRIAGISAAVAGRSDHPSAVLDRERAAAYQEQATKLRDEYAAQHRKREEEREGQKAEAPKPKQETDKSRTDNKELSDAQRAKLDRNAATREVYTRRDQDEARSRQPGMGGRGR